MQILVLAAERTSEERKTCNCDPLWVIRELHTLFSPSFQALFGFLTGGCEHVNIYITGAHQGPQSVWQTYRLTDT